MSEFKVTLSGVRAESSDIYAILGDLNKYQSSLSGLESGVSVHSTSAARSLSNAQNTLRKAVTGAADMAAALQNIANYYEKAELEILGKADSQVNILSSVLGLVNVDEQGSALAGPIGLSNGVEYAVNFIGNALYSGLLSKDVEERLKELIEKDYLADNNFLVSSVLQDATDVTQDGLEPFENIQNLMQWVKQDDELEIPVIGKVMEYVNTIDLGIDMIRSVEDYVTGMVNGDTETMAEGGKGLFTSAMKCLSKVNWTEQDKVIAPSILNPSGLLINYATNMVTGYIDAITAENATAEDVFYETFMDSGLNVSLDAVEEASNAGIIMVYEPISWAADKFGFDLDAVYEKHSDKEGVFAAMDNVSQVVDLVKENSSWESWKNGMGIMWKGIKGLFS